MKTGRNSRCWVRCAFRLSLGCLYRRNNVFYNLRFLSFVIRYDLGIMHYHSKILIRSLSWDSWLPRCSKNLARSCQESQDTSERVNPRWHRLLLRWQPLVHPGPTGGNISCIQKIAKIVTRTCYHFVDSSPAFTYLLCAISTSILFVLP